MIKPSDNSRTSAIRRLASESEALANFDFAATVKALVEAGIAIEEPPQDIFGRFPENAALDEIVEFQRLIDVGLRSWRMSPVRRHALDTAFGRVGMSTRLLLSNARLREQATLLLIDAVTSLWREKSYAFYFLTLLDDRGNALEFDCELSLEALRHRFQAVLIESGLHAFGVIEVQGLTDIPGQGSGRTLSFHGHAVGWTSDPAFDADAVQRRLCALPTLRNWLGARTVVIKPVGPNLRHLTWKAYYLLKAPTVGKRLVRDASTPSGFAFRHVAVRSDLAVRLMEALTQLEYSEMLFAAGDGVAVQANWLAHVSEWHRARLGEFADFNDEGDLADVWAQLRSRRRGRVRSSIDFHAPPSEAPTAWETAARAYLASRPATRRYSRRKRK